MSFENLISPERHEFVVQIYSEIQNNVTSSVTFNASDPSFYETQKATFFSLMNENNQLLENEKEYCKEKYVYDIELNLAMRKLGEPKECEKCNATKYSERFCENCISLHLQNL